ncbi:ankyrin repeat and death domain-containing protein 1A-like isoform X2 [Bacillus rossius redtenbacheri]|uniref:ankyrin repeat and death domain-containing protein 1A-like isoform X2 n=1 Tax=Bacillus rossius redtenbacheri TaxID=93214 RepID=UPI002FDD88DF
MRHRSQRQVLHEAPHDGGVARTQGRRGDAHQLRRQRGGCQQEAVLAADVRGAQRPRRRGRLPAGHAGEPAGGRERRRAPDGAVPRGAGRPPAGAGAPRGRRRRRRLPQQGGTHAPARGLRARPRGRRGLPAAEGRGQRGARRAGRHAAPRGGPQPADRAGGAVAAGGSAARPAQRGFTPLHFASSLGCRGIIESLLQYGSCINSKSKNGSTPLHLACQAEKTDTVELLIAKGSSLNEVNARMQCPIHIAAEQGYTEICKMLLAAGADIAQKEQSGKTPLYIAARGSFTAIVDMIIKTARLDYPQPEEELCDAAGAAGVRRCRYVEDAVTPDTNVRLRQLLWRLAYKHLADGEWKRLAHHWAFTDEQIHAIEHQYTGPSSYKEHGFRMLLIWANGLKPEVNPIKELCESLAAIGKKNVADAFRKKLDTENEQYFQSEKSKCWRCALF